MSTGSVRSFRPSCIHCYACAFTVIFYIYTPFPSLFFFLFFLFLLPTLDCHLISFTYTMYIYPNLHTSLMVTLQWYLLWISTESIKLFLFILFLHSPLCLGLHDPLSSIYSLSLSLSFLHLFLVLTSTPDFYL